MVGAGAGANELLMRRKGNDVLNCTLGRIKYTKKAEDIVLRSLLGKVEL